METKQSTATTCVVREADIYPNGYTIPPGKRKKSFDMLQIGDTYLDSDSFVHTVSSDNWPYSPRFAGPRIILEDAQKRRRWSIVVEENTETSGWGVCGVGEDLWLPPADGSDPNTGSTKYELSIEKSGGPGPQLSFVAITEIVE